MSNEDTAREQILRAVIAVTLTGIGLASGASIPALAMLAGVAGGIGGNWLANLTEDLFHAACDRTFRPDDQLNHDLAWALATAWPAAIRSVRQQWRQSQAYQRLRRSANRDERFEAHRTLIALRWLSQDAARVLTVAALRAALPDAHRPLHTLAHTIPAAEAQTQAQTLLATALQPYVKGRADAFTAFVADHLLTSWLLRLREILKDPGERSTRAYRAYTLGDDVAARPLYERALAIRERVQGADHPATATSLNNLALLLDDLGEHAEAAQMMRRAVAIRAAVFGAEHPHTQRLQRRLDNIEARCHVQR